MKDFETYLQYKHADQYVGLDDEMPDDFNEWLEDLPMDEWILMAEYWKTDCVCEALKKLETSVFVSHRKG